MRVAAQAHGDWRKGGQENVSTFCSLLPPLIQIMPALWDITLLLADLPGSVLPHLSLPLVSLIFSKYCSPPQVTISAQ